ncbi:MAG: hypothetical protein RX318_01230 [bacterium]|jgi:hypothetical protein|nr:hypothetical protein [bacterium]
MERGESNVVAARKGRLQDDPVSPLAGEGGFSSPPPPPVAKAFCLEPPPGGTYGGLLRPIPPREVCLEYRGWQIQYFRVTPTVDGQPLLGAILVNWVIQSPRRILIERSRPYYRKHRLKQIIRWVFTKWEKVRRLKYTAGLPLSGFKKSVQDRPMAAIHKRKKLKAWYGDSRLV